MFAALKDSDPDRAHEALNELCRVYWPPLYAFARREGISPFDAKDLVQGLLQRLCERDAFRTYAPTPGVRFRTWLITCFKRFKLDEWRRVNTQKRGGQIQQVSLDIPDEDGHAMFEIAGSPSPEATYDAVLARTLTGMAFDRLRQEHTVKGLGEVYDALAPMILATDLPDKMEHYRRVAAKVGMTVEALAKRKERVSKRFGEILREEARRLVETDDEVEDELRHLLAALA